MKGKRLNIWERKTAMAPAKITTKRFAESFPDMKEAIQDFKENMIGRIFSKFLNEATKLALKSAISETLHTSRILESSMEEAL